MYFFMHVCLHIYFCLLYYFDGLPRGLSGKESAYQCTRCGFDPWVRKISWKKKWQPTLVFWPEKSHGQRSLVGHSPWGGQELGTTERLSTHCFDSPNVLITAFGKIYYPFNDLMTQFVVFYWFLCLRKGDNHVPLNTEESESISLPVMSDSLQPYKL